MLRKALILSDVLNYIIIHKVTCICFLQIEINNENAEDVINNLTMNVELADKADQIAINFAVITEVIVAQAQTREPTSIPLQQQINV